MERSLFGGKSSDPNFCDTQAYNRQTVHTDTQADRKTNRERDRQTHIHTDRQRDGQTERQDSLFYEVDVCHLS